MTETQHIITPVGRFVQGDIFNPQTTDMKGRPRTDKNNNPRHEFFVGIAIRKDDPGMNDFLRHMQTVAQQDFPSGEWRKPDFFWKKVDGDLPENAAKPGFPGCWIFRMTNGFSVKAFTRGGESQIVDPKQIKRGDYIRANVSVNGNGDQMRPGLYINVWLIEFVAYGEEITLGPDPRAVFGSAPEPTLPPGASVTPVAAGPGIAAPGAPMPSTYTQAQAAAGPAPAVPDPLATPGPVQATQAVQSPAPGITPAYDFLDPKPTRKMTDKAGANTYEAYRAKGWTDEQLIQHGFMTIDAPAPDENFPPF